MKTNTLKTISVVVSLLAGMGVASADTRAGGEGTITDITLNNTVDEVTDIWEILESEPLTLTSASQCIVTACSDVINTSAGTTDNDYNFVIASVTNPGLNTVSERHIELSDNPGINDPDVWPVCSTRHLSLPSGSHTIYWLGAKESASDVNTRVEDTTMTIGCFPGTEL